MPKALESTGNGLISDTAGPIVINSSDGDDINGGGNVVVPNINIDGCYNTTGGTIRRHSEDGCRAHRRSPVSVTSSRSELHEAGKRLRLQDHR
jgi:hypothetical protein